MKNRLLIFNKIATEEKTLKIKQVTHCLQFMGKNANTVHFPDVYHCK